MIKKSIVMSVGLSSAILTLGATDIHANEKGTVTTSVLNVRSGAGTNHSIIGKLYKGNTVEILESSKGWYKVKLSNGKTGWSSGDYISIKSSTPGTSTSGYGKVTTSALNVRSGAGTNHSIIGKVYKNDTVKLLSSSNGWYKVELSNGKTGWCSGQYITKVSSPSTSNPDTSTPESSVSGYGKVTTSTLNVRSGAGTNHSIIGKVYKNNTVKLLSSSKGWYKVELSNGKTGWCSGQYITKVSNPSTSNPGTSTPESSVSGYGKVTTSVLNVRSGAGTNHSIIDKLYRNETVKLLSSSKGWYKVELSNKKVGWVSGDYITKVDNPGTTNPDKPSSNKQEAVVNLAKKQIGKPYVWGAEGPDSFDCSGLTYYVYKNAAGITLPRTSTAQSKTGTTVSRADLQPGDLIFSSTDGSGNVSHVGIYVGNGEMIHSPKPGDVVQKTSINNSYWNSTYLWAKRVL